MGAGSNSSKEEKKTDKQILREQTRMIERADRNVQREITKMDALEKKQLNEIKKLAEKGQHTAAKTLAKTIAMTRKQKTNFYSMSA